MGVSDYKEIMDLDYAHRDAQLMANILQKTFPTQNKNIVTLTNEQVTEYRVYEEIRKMLTEAQEGDLCILYFSGHGDVITDIVEDEQGYFLAHDASKTRVYNSGGAINFTYFSKAAAKLTSVKKADVWVITDACKSGKAIDPNSSTTTLTALTTSFQSTTNFISCAPHEFSFEDSIYQQGVFTYYLVKALSGEAESDGKPGVLTADEIGTYLKNSVREYTKGKQSPKVKTSNDFAPIFNSQPDLVAFLSTTKENSDLSMAKGDDDGPKSSHLLEYERILLQDQADAPQNALNYSKGNAAKFSPAEKKIAQAQLIEVLMDRIQKSNNRFLSGMPTMRPEEKYETTVKDIALLKTVLPADHPLMDNISFREQFFTALVAINRSNPQSLSDTENSLLALLKKDPFAAHVNQALAQLYLKTGQLDKAKQQLEQAQKTVKTWTKPIQTQAYAAVISGQLDQAKTWLNKAENLTDKTNNDNNLLIKAQLFSAQLELGKVQRTLNSVASYKLNPIDKARKEADLAVLQGRLKSAEKGYLSLLEKNDTDKETILEIIGLYKQEKDSTQVLKYLKKIQQLEPNNNQWKLQYDLYSGKNPILNKENVNLRSSQEVLEAVDHLENNKKYGDALTLLNESLAFLSWDPELHFAKGRVQYSAGSTVEAIVSLKKALDLSPYHFKSIRALAYIYLAQKKCLDADALIKSYDRYFKESSKWLTFTYDIYRRCGSKNDLFVILEKALKFDSLETDVYKALYQLHLDNGDYKNAHREFQSLHSLEGSSQDSANYFAAVQKQVYSQIARKDFVGLQEGLKLLLELDPMDMQKIYYMALVYYMDGEYELANKTLNKLSKFMNEMGVSTQMEFYQLKGKIFLETKKFAEAEQSFKLALSNNAEPHYLGLAMAQFELGKDGWMNYFYKDQDLSLFNQDAQSRFEKMMKKASKK